MNLHIVETKEAKSRHPAISGKLCRSFGVEDFQDLVVQLSEDGTITIREEPVDRKLKRNERLPEVVLNVREVFDAGNKRESNTPAQIESKIDRVLARLPVADFSGAPEKFTYLAKVWLMRELDREFNPE